MLQERELQGQTLDRPEATHSAPEDLCERMRKLFVPGSQTLNMDASAIGAQLRGPLDHDEPICSTFAEARQAIAPGFGCDSSELVITYSTTDALSRIIAGLDLKEGDEILTTNHEHYGSLAPLALIRDRRRVSIRKVTLPVGNHQCAEDYVTLFASAFTAKTKVLLFSSPTATIGTVLPIASLAALAQQHGCISILDGAHIPGMLNYRFEELGVDFLAGSGTKWQCGPAGTGILYVRNRVLPRFNPRPLPTFWPVISIWYPLEGGLPPRTTTSSPSYDIAEYLQTCGSASRLRIQGFQIACETWDSIGRSRIEQDLLGLSDYLKERIVEVWGSESLYSPREDHRLLSAISAFNPFRGSSDAFDEIKFQTFVARLESEHQVIVRYSRFSSEFSLERFAIRIATRPFHDRADVDRSIESMINLCADMA